jgi:hypothetical protein
VLTSKGYLVVNKKKNKATLYPNSAKNPIKYLKIYVNGKPRLYEYVQTEFEQQNPSDYQVSSPDRITYKPVSKLGLPNYILEYNYGANIENSVLVNAKNTPNPKVAPKAATMDDVSNSYLASFQAEEAAAAMQGDSQDLSTLLPPSSTPLSAGMDFLQNAMDRSATMQETMNSEEGVTQPVQTQTNTWDEYKALIKELIKVDKDAALEIGVLTEEEFLSLPEKEKKMAIWQIKNC